MKIQPSTPKSITSKTKKTKPSSQAFGALFSSQLEEEETVTPANQQSQTSTPQHTAPNIEQTLDQLEHAIHNLKVDISENSEGHQHAQDAIANLRYALANQENAALLSPRDLQEAETLLAVEAKRLEALDKYK